jgi:hypothetical protein
VTNEKPQRMPLEKDSPEEFVKLVNKSNDTEPDEENFEKWQNLEIASTD